MNSMQQGIRVATTQRQVGKLSPQMRQAIDYLQLTMPELREKITHEVDLNPLIDYIGNPNEVSLGRINAGEGREQSDSGADKPLDFTPSGPAAERTLAANDGHLDYFMGDSGSNLGNDGIAVDYSNRRQHFFDSQVQVVTLQEHLTQQLALSSILPEHQPIAEAMIGELDDNGYFRGSLPDFAMTGELPVSKLEEMLEIIGTFDPLGCGARTPQETLAWQLPKLKGHPARGIVAALITSYLPTLADRRYGDICRALRITEKQLQEAITALRTLDPKPGRAYPSNRDRPEYINPEVTARRDGTGRWRAIVNDSMLPEIHISPKYREILNDEHAEPETKNYVRARLEKIVAIEAAVESRHEMLATVAQAVFDAQPNFFTKGLLGLTPMTETAIARQTGYEVSTVSRAALNKYVKTPFGILPLRRFFVTGGVSAADGSRVTPENVAEKIAQLIAAEDPTAPLSDDAIAKRLAAEGLKIARRTVAKYRMERKIPGALERRQK